MDNEATHIVKHSHKVRSPNISSRLPTASNNHLSAPLRGIARLRTDLLTLTDNLAALAWHHLPNHSLEPLQPSSHTLRRPRLLPARRVGAFVRPALLNAQSARLAAVAFQFRRPAWCTGKHDTRALRVLLLLLLRSAIVPWRRSRPGVCLSTVAGERRVLVR